MNYVKMIRSLEMIYEKLTAVRKIKTHIKKRALEKPIGEVLKDFGIYIKENETFDLNEIVDTMAKSQIKKKDFIHPSRDEPHENELDAEEVAFIESLNINFKNPTEADLKYLRETIELLREDYSKVVKYMEVYVKDDTIVAKTPEGEIDLATDVKNSQEEAIEYLKELGSDDSTEDIVDTYVTLFYTARKLNLPHEKDDFEKKLEQVDELYTYEELAKKLEELEKLLGRDLVFKLGSKKSGYLVPNIKQLELALEDLKKLLKDAKKMFNQKQRMMQDFTPHGFGKMFRAVANRQLLKSIEGIPKDVEEMLKKYEGLFEYLSYYFEHYVKPFQSEIAPLVENFLVAQNNNVLRQNAPERYNELLEQIGQCLSEIEYYSFNTRTNGYDNLRRIPASVVNYLERNNMAVRLDMLNSAVREYKQKRIDRAFEKVAEKEKYSENTPEKPQRNLR